MRRRAEGAVPAVPRPAATVVVARPSAAPLEVLLLRRPARARFAAGAWVFPGGAIDEDDASPAWVGRRPVVGEPTACVAALRELFEETGILPGSRSDRSSGRLAETRRALLAGRVTFSEVAEPLRIDFSSLQVAYFARWITPTNAVLRFDTRFFLLGTGERPGPVCLTSEHERSLWTTPGDALDRFAAGELPMLFPTAKTLERLAAFASLEAALEALRDVTVAPALVKLHEGGARVRPLAPGDPGYEEVP